MRKYHFSRAETRAMALDHPIGDPTGGAAYGEKNDPVSAVISLATMGGTYATAATAAGAAAGIGATFSAMSVMQGITFAGAALNLVGNISGNKTLQKIGMVAGIAGGIGQLAGIQGQQLGATKIGQSLGLKLPTETGTGALNLAPAASNSNAQYAGVNVGAQSGATTVAAPPATPSTQGPVTPPPSAVTPPPAGTSSVWESVKDAGKSVLDFTKEYPGAAVMLGSTATTLADYLSGKTDAELDKLEAEKSFFGAKTNEIQEAINLERQRRKNLNEGWAQVDTGIKVNPNISMQPAGLIAQQMPA